jgi:hypothetical protein
MHLRDVRRSSILMSTAESKHEGDIHILVPYHRHKRDSSSSLVIRPTRLTLLNAPLMTDTDATVDRVLLAIYGSRGIRILAECARNDTTLVAAAVGVAGTECAVCGTAGRAVAELAC